MPRTDGFLCYAHADGRSPSRAYVDELQRHLRHIDPGHAHRPWSDQDLRAGEDWPKALRAALDRAAYAVLFINIELIDSEFVRKVELPALLKAAEDDGLLLLALRVGTCGLPDWLARIEFSNHEDTPLCAAKRPTRDRAYTAVAARVEEHLRGGPSPSQSVRLMAQTRGAEPARALVGTSETASAPLPDLAGTLSRHVGAALERLKARYLRGERAAALAELDALIDDEACSALDPRLRGRLLRTAALYRLALDQDGEAEALAQRAREADPDGDHQVIDAQLALHRDGPAAALRLLDPPGSAQARHLRAALLIQTDDPAGALAALEADADFAVGGDPAQDEGAEPQAGDGGEASTPDLPVGTTDRQNAAETWRLRGLALLALKRLPEAAEAIAQARALAPDWLGVRAAAAQIGFWRACAPAALDLTAQPLWPMPFARALVRADTQSRAGLAEAAQTFAEIAAGLPDGSDGQGHWLTWRLIALITASAPRPEASALASRLLSDEGRINIWPLVWAQFHGLDLDRESLKRRLAEVPAEDPNAVPLRGLYLELRLEDGEAEQVLAELPDLARLAVARGQAEVSPQWTIAILTAAGRFDEAERAAAEVDDERKRLRLRLLIAREREQAEPGSHKTAAAALLAVDPGPDCLAEACEAHARAADWAFVAEHAEALLAAVPTPNSLRLLVNASFNEGRYQRCLHALDDHRSVYPEGRLPPDLALLRVRCQRMLGETSEAAREARRLWERERTAKYLTELIDIQIQGGDLGAARESLRQMLAVEGATAEMLLRGANLAAVAGDRDLAVLLWRRAGEIGSDSADFAGGMAFAGSTLGVGRETEPWFRRMVAETEAGIGSGTALRFSEVLDLMREQREAGHHIKRLYERAEVPVHLLPEHLSPPLSVLFHAIPERNRTDFDPLLAAPVLVRHGARPLPDSGCREVLDGRLVLDITAILTAADLGLLDALETHLAPLWLTPNWRPLLLDEIRRLSPHQPDRIEAERRVADLVRAGGIARVDLGSIEPPLELVDLIAEHRALALGCARAAQGCLVEFLPLTGPDPDDRTPVDLPPDWMGHLIGPHALLDQALADGLIDARAHARGLEHLPPDPVVASAGVRPGAYLLVQPGILIAFAGAEVLGALAQGYRLAVADDVWRHTEAELSQHDRSIPLIGWLRALIQRLGDGLQADTYRIAPSTAPPQPSVEYPTRGLDDLIHFPGEPGDLLWIDDRCLNGYPKSESAQVIGVVEVLGLMRDRNKVSDVERFRWLQKLRAGNYQFIPLDADEILHWLGQAHSDGGRLVVPTELDVIARYWAGCLHGADALQWVGNERHPNGERPFYKASRSAVHRVLSVVWSDARLNVRRRELRADWVLDNLHVGVADIPHFGPEPSPERDRALIGMDQARLCFGAFKVVFEHPGRRKRAKKIPASRQRKATKGKTVADRASATGEAYLRWACERLVVPRLRADPDSLGQTAAALRRLILGSPALDDDALAFLGGLLPRFLPVLPPQLRTELSKDQDLMQRLGLSEFGVIELGGLRLPTPAFWAAVEAALRGLRPILHDADTGKALSLQRVSEPDDPRPILDLADETGKTVREGYFEYTELLLDSRKRRLQALRSHPHWWDGDPDGCDALERRLAALEPADSRIHRLIETVEHSADAHYLAIASQWRRDRGMGLDRCFPPPLAAVLTWLRWDTRALTTGVDTDLLWRRLAASIPPERGLGEALGRMARLPCPLPDAAHAWIAGLDAAQTTQLLGGLTTDLTDPLGRLHLIDLLLGAAGRCPAALELAQSQIAHLASARFDDEVELLLALVDLAYRAFGCEPGATDTPAGHRLLAAWAHAGRIVGTLLTGPCTPHTVAKQLRAWNPFPYRNLYAPGDEPTEDLAWPWQVHTADLRHAALGRVLSRHPVTAAGLDLSSMQERWQGFLTGEPDARGEFHLLADPALLPDVLRCLWGGDRSVLLAPVLGPELANQCSPGAFAERIGEALAQLEADPQQFHPWRTLTATVGAGRLPDAQAERLAAILEQLDLDALIAADPVLQIPVVDLAIRHTRQPERLADLVLGWAGGLDTAAQPGPGFRAMFSADAEGAFEERLTHWLHGLAVRHSGDPDAEFGRLLEAAILRSRAFAAYLSGPLRNIARHLPYSPHRALRRALLAARARSGTTGAHSGDAP